MPGPVTAHYGWVMPLPGGDPTIWGNELNTLIGQVDGQVYANQLAAALAPPVGSLVMFAGGSAPANWLICDGSSLSTTTYATLFNVIGYAFGGSGGSFNLPLFNGRFPVGAYGFSNIGALGGEANHTLAASEMPVHAHGVSDPGHAHSIADPGHAHGISDPGHSHGASQDAHNHTVTIGATFGFGVGPQAPPNPMMNQGSSGYTTSTAQPAVHISASGVGITIAGAGTGIGIYAAGTGVSIQNAGSGGAHNNMPPYTGVNFIIRYQ